ncbi:hypothetical protein CLOM_g24225 [Closterium sp. NIES-68]|nr:hypothetical protein CLOM_g24225 [Closterium sp. NIES-68]GJP85509.1 hypothetical protein CLOP_g15600 [Closterium sp. NIES-67]
MTATSISAACCEFLLPRRRLAPHAPPFPRPAFGPSVPSNSPTVGRPPRAHHVAVPRAQSSSHGNHDDRQELEQRATSLSRRDALLSLALLPPALSASALVAPSPSIAASPPAPDTTVTQRAFLDFALCPTAVRLDRTLGDDTLICTDGAPLGRVVLGLYGRAAPDTVAQFARMVAGEAGSTYKGSVIHRSLPGQYVQAGHQGQVARGDVPPPTLLPPNRDTVAAASFALSHLRPGTVSLCVGENDDEERARARSSYRNVEFLITTGPGPATQLDGDNIVFGTVLQGMEVIAAVAAVPTFQPSDRIRQFNDFATLLGDDRAAKGRGTWNRPLKAIVITDCGLLD